MSRVMFFKICHEAPTAKRLPHYKSLWRLDYLSSSVHHFRKGCFFFPSFLFVAVIMDGNARRTGSAPLLFGLIQMVRLKAAAPAKASLIAQGKWPLMFNLS